MTLSTETQYSLTSGNFTDRSRLRCEHQHPRLHRYQWSSTEESKEKGSVLLQHFAQQSNQNNLDERKAVWKGLDKTLTEAGSNDELITELKFIEALSRLSKDTAPGPDKIKYSDIKDLSVDNKSELFRLYEESFVTGQVSED